MSKTIYISIAAIILGALSFMIPVDSGPVGEPVRIEQPIAPAAHASFPVVEVPPEDEMIGRGHPLDGSRAMGGESKD